MLKDFNTKDFTGLAFDSRKVKSGYAFFAIKGAEADGHDYVQQAIANGAAVVVSERAVDSSVPNIVSNNIRHDLALEAAEFYGKQPSFVAAITGTNGKTSVADFVRQLWEMENRDAASIGTLGIIRNGKEQHLNADNTSPDPIQLHQALSQINDAAIIEASSIGIEQHRLDGVRIKAAAFTNFTQDHLDYHGSMEEYFHCKTMLFDLLDDDGIAVINRDLPDFPLKQKVVSFGTNAALEVLESTPLPDGQILKLNIFGKQKEVKVGLIGRFQADNILCSIGLSGTSEGLENLKSVPGRMEQAISGVYIDYAHTPDALENALDSIRPHCHGKLILVFGCGGDRDKGKRPLMGEIAARLADDVIVTDDNPRTENADDIRKQILAKCTDAQEIKSRAEAIEKAVKMKNDGDIVLIAGKGHEKYQIIGKEKHYFDDFAIVRDIT